MKIILRFKGGKGSGHFDHKGRTGLQGGSLPYDSIEFPDKGEVLWPGNFSELNANQKNGLPIYQKLRRKLFCTGQKVGERYLGTWNMVQQEI
jgi:hypothetical protein